MRNGRCRVHRGKSPGAPKGNRHAFRHGGYAAEALASRREVAALIRAMRALAGAAEGIEPSVPSGRLKIGGGHRFFPAIGRCGRQRRANSLAMQIIADVSALIGSLDIVFGEF